MTARAVVLPRVTRRWVAVAAYAAVNIGLALEGLRPGPEQTDWQLWAALPQALASGTLYASSTDAPFLWSPVAGWLMAGVAYLGYWPWFVLHVAVVFLMKPGVVTLLTLVSWAFWIDTVQGNTLTFAFVAGALALRGHRLAGVSYLALFLLMPRPVQLPLAAWLLWKQPDLRLPGLVLFVSHMAAVLASGYTEEWLTAMVSHPQPAWNVGPSFFLGLWWLVVGVPLGVWLAWRGRVGLAGLAMSPYLLPQYLLMPLLDLRARAPQGSFWPRADRNP